MEHYYRPYRSKKRYEKTQPIFVKQQNGWWIKQTNHKWSKSSHTERKVWADLLWGSSLVENN